jgi:hypothetical protein
MGKKAVKKKNTWLSSAKIEKDHNHGCGLKVIFILNNKLGFLYKF